MIRNTRALLVLPLMLVVASTAPASSTEYPWQMEEIADGVFAALQPATDRFDESNSTVIVGVNEVVVVDAQANPAAVHSLIAWIRATTNAPVRLVINTHWHADHTQGNAIYRDAFGPELEIIGHGSLVEDIPERAAGFVHERQAYLEAELPAAQERLAQGVFRDGSSMTDEERGEQAEVLADAETWLESNRDARFVVPNRRYDLRQRLRRADRTIDLIHFEGHTRGDTVVWLPDQGIALTGDLLDDLPYAGHGYPSSWRAALATLAEMPIRTTVPGHGPIFVGPEKLQTVAAYLDALIEVARATVASGGDLDAAMASFDAEYWRTALASDATAEMFFDQTLTEAMQRAVLEARGELD